MELPAGVMGLPIDRILTATDTAAAVAVVAAVAAAVPWRG